MERHKKIFRSFTGLFLCLQIEHKLWFTDEIVYQSHVCVILHKKIIEMVKKKDLRNKRDGRAIDVVREPIEVWESKELGPFGESAMRNTKRVQNNAMGAAEDRVVSCVEDYLIMFEFYITGPGFERLRKELTRMYWN